jgi:lipoyl(octanoyl) transferase
VTTYQKEQNEGHLLNKFIFDIKNLKNKTVQIEDLGHKDFKWCWDYQETYFQKILDIKINNRRTDQQKDTPNYLIFVEHPHVYTLGKSGDINNLKISDTELEKVNATYYKINRGGDITYHGPGQVVAYPILDLENFFTDIHMYLRLLEESVIKTLAEFDIKGERSKGETGVWIDVGTPYARKICAMGVRASRWVTMHGLAFNINTDLNYFNHIIPCGIEDKTVTSLNKELGKASLDLDKIKNLLTKHFLELFEATKAMD